MELKSQCRLSAGKKKSKRTGMLKTILLFIFILTSSKSFASEVLKIGTMDLPPYGWQEKSGEKKGIIFELNEEIGKRSKMKYTNVILPFKRMLTLLQTGKIDLVSSQAHEESRKAGDKLAVQFDIDVIAGTRKSSQIRSFADLNGKRFIYHRSASYKQLEGFPKSITRVSSYEQSLSLLNRNRKSDAAVFSEPAYYYWMKELGLNKNDFGNVILIEANKKQWIFVRRSMSQALRVKLKKIVQDIYKENLYDKLLVKYGKH